MTNNIVVINIINEYHEYVLIYVFVVLVFLALWSYTT